MNTTFKSVRSHPVPSPFQSIRRNASSAFNTQEKKHPIRDAIGKSVGTFSLSCEIAEDIATISQFKRIKGLVAFTCAIKRDGEIVGFGRGTAVLGPMNRYIDRTVQIAVNSSVIDAVVRATKGLDALRLGVESAVADNASVIGEAYQSTENNAYDSATPKQVEYLRQLVATSIFDDEERNRWEDQISSFSRSDAHEAIQTLTRNK